MDKFFIGQIVKAQGIKGEVKVKSNDSALQLIKKHRQLLINDIQMKVKSIRIDGDFAYICFIGIDDRNKAEELRDLEVFADKSSIELDENDYYISDIVSCKVQFIDGYEIGVVTEVLQNGKSADIFVVEGTKNVMFPFLKDLVIEVDLITKRIIVDNVRFKEVALYED